MLKIILNGCNGKMGKVITDIVTRRNDCAIVAGIDRELTQNGPYPVFQSLEDIHVEADVVVDFSNPAALDGLCSFCRERHLGIVIATTGFTADQTAQIKQLACNVPVFFSFNMSLGINLLAELARKAAAVLEGFDIEIIEKHHNQKIDAPSGTALMLADEINAEAGERYHYEYNRQPKHEKRDPKEIGIHAVRGGTIVGEHEIIFAGRDEIVTLSHSARSKEIFAVGAVNAAAFLKAKQPGLYTMKELVAEK